MTIREALVEGSRALAAAGITSHSLDAALLLADVLTVSRASLAAAAPDPLDEEALAAFRGYIKRRLDGACVAYIVGRKEFYGLEFLVNPKVLVPRPETETLVQVTVNSEQLTMNNEPVTTEGKPPRVLDVCTGSGAVAIAVKHHLPQVEVWATDMCADALEVAGTNAARLLPPGSIQFFRGDLFEALPTAPHCLFSLIVSNPPYVPAADIPGLSPEVRAEPVLALDGGEDGLAVIRRIIAGAPQWLNPGGALLLEADPRQMQAIAGLLAEHGFEEITTFTDLSGDDRVIRGRKPV